MAKGSQPSNEPLPARWYALYGQGYATRRRMLHHIKAHDIEEAGLFDATDTGNWYGELTQTEHRACAILILAGLVRYDTDGPTPTLHLTEDGAATESALSTHTPHARTLLGIGAKRGSGRPQSAVAQPSETRR